MSFSRRTVRFLRQRDWPAAGFELIVVALGVLLGITASNWNEDRVRDNRSRMAITALREDFRDTQSVEDRAVVEVRRGLAEFDAASARGEKPIPYYFLLSGAFTPPSTIWDAALQSNLVDLVHPELLFDLGYYYSERRGIGERYVDYARFVEREVLPYEDRDPARFYGPDGQLRPEFAANMERLRDWIGWMEAIGVSAQCLDVRFAAPSKPGERCRHDYGEVDRPDRER